MGAEYKGAAATTKMIIVAGRSENLSMLFPLSTAVVES